MKTKKKICSQCGKEKYIWKNSEGERYCQSCWHSIKYSTLGKPTSVKKPLAPRSSKRVKLDNEYSQLRKIYLTKHPMCEASLPQCTQNATDIHHKKGRGKYYLVVNTWMAVCRTCHNWIETHPIEATDLGFRESKITE